MFTHMGQFFTELQTSPAGGTFQSFSGLTNNKPTVAPTFAFGAVTNKPFSSLTPAAENISGTNAAQHQSSTASAVATTSTTQSSAAFSFGLLGQSSASAISSKPAGVSMSFSGLESKTTVSASSTKSQTSSSTSVLSGCKIFLFLNVVLQVYMFCNLLSTVSCRYFFQTGQYAFC